MERNGEKLNLSGGISGGNGPQKKRVKTEEQSSPKNKRKSPIDLNLDLSTNGRFGVNPSRRPRDRSASGGGARGRHAPPARTRSDPAEKGKAPAVSSPARTSTVPAGKGKGKEKGKEKGKGKAPVVHSPARGGSDGNGGVGVQYLGGGGVGVQYLGGGGVGVQYLMESPSHGANQNTMMVCSLCPPRGVECPVVGNNLNETEKLLTNALLNMPHVKTLGSCPNHVQIKGILYRYRKAEELKIVCVCHGKFLSPAEFIKHGGGGDVADPLKHIVVDPSPMFHV